MILITIDYRDFATRSSITEVKQRRGFSHVRSVPASFRVCTLLFHTFSNYVSWILRGLVLVFHRIVKVVRKIHSEEKNLKNKGIFYQVKFYILFFII